MWLILKDTVVKEDSVGGSDEPGIKMTGHSWVGYLSWGLIGSTSCPAPQLTLNAVHVFSLPVPQAIINT